MGSIRDRVIYYYKLTDIYKEAGINHINAFYFTDICIGDTDLPLISIDTAINIVSKSKEKGADILLDILTKLAEDYKDAFNETIYIAMEPPCLGNGEMEVVIQ